MIVAGEASPGSYRSSESMQRLFCTTCGSPSASRRDHLPQVRVRLGRLDTPLSTGSGAHIFVGSKADGFEIHDDLPRHPGRPPG